MARPTKDASIILGKRNALIKHCLLNNETQADIARIFKVHKSVISKYIKNDEKLQRFLDR